jgi:cell division septation protein DedD
VSSRWAAALIAALVAVISPDTARAGFDAGLDAHARGDYAKAHAEWLPLAEAGDVAAQSNLGVMVWKGQGIEADPVEAARWFRLAAERGNSAAQDNLGLMYYLGEGVPKDHDAAARWIKAAAYQGDPSAQLRLGVLYAEGTGVERDPERAMLWWGKSAAQGNAAAQARIAVAGESSAVDPASERAAPRRQSPEPRAAAPQAPAIADSDADSDAAPTLPDVTPSAASAPSPRLPTAPPPSPAPTSPRPEVASRESEPPAPPNAVPQSAGFLIQIAAVWAEEDVEPEWARLQRRNRDLLGDLELDVQKRDHGARVVYRLRAGPPLERAAAERLCAALKERRLGCLLREAP